LSCVSLGHNTWLLGINENGFLKAVGIMSNGKGNSNIVGWLALVVSLAAFGLSTYQYIESNEERLIIRTKPSTLNTPVLIPFIDLSHKYHLVYLPFNMSITNDGSKTISLLEHRRFLLLDEGPIEENKIFYSGIDGGLLNLNGEKAILPKALSQGVTITYVSYIGVRIDSKVANLLKPYQEKRVTRRDLMIILGRNGVDIYGNQVHYDEAINGSIGYRLKDAGVKTPMFLFQWKTGRGNVFSTLGGDYSFASY
jgi:hypothetical protein